MELDNIDFKIIENYYDQAFNFVLLLRNENIMDRVNSQRDAARIAEVLHKKYPEFTIKEIAGLLVIVGGIGMMLEGLPHDIRYTTETFAVMMEYYYTNKKAIYTRVGNEHEDILRNLMKSFPGRKE